MVDIILATYNGEKYLSKLLDSLDDQTFQDFRVIISDDGSSDDTISIARDYMEKSEDGRVILSVNHPYAKRAAGNFMSALTMSDADYVMFCDQDDVWLETKIEDTLGKMISTEEMIKDLLGEETAEEMMIPVLVHTDAYVADTDLNCLADSFMDFMGLPHELSSPEYLIQNNVLGCSSMMNRQLAEMMQYAYGRKMDAIMMHDHFAALIASFFGAVSYLDKPTLYYRQHEDNSVGARSLKGLGGVLNGISRGAEDFRGMVYDYSRQARYFTYLFNPYITDEGTMAMLRDFGHISSMKKTDRIKVLKRYGIEKRGALKKAGQYLFV